MFNKDVLKLIAKMLVLVMIMGICDVFLGVVFKHLLKYQVNGRFYDISYNLDKTEADLILIGSSRVQNDYDIDVFSKELHLSTWKIGLGGQGLIYFRAVEKTVIQRHTPKLIVLNIDPNALEGDVEYDKLSLLRPYASDHLFIEEALCSKDKFEKYKLYSNIYCFNSMFYYLLDHSIYNKKEETKDNITRKAFKGTDSTLVIPKESEVNTKTTKATLNPKKVEMLLEMIDDVTQKNIPFVLAFAPNYYASNPPTATMNYVKKIKERDNLYIVDFSSDTSMVEKAPYFYNMTHMNQEGARVYSKRMSDWLKLHTKLSPIK